VCRWQMVCDSIPPLGPSVRVVNNGLDFILFFFLFYFIIIQLCDTEKIVKGFETDNII